MIVPFISESVKVKAMLNSICLKSENESESYADLYL